MDPFRIYEPDELGSDNYPRAWHKIDGGPGVKHLVREHAEHRCERCGHPYKVGQTDPAWSRCDERCTHDDGSTRWLCQVEHAGEHFASCIREGAWRVLTVHHLNGDKADLRWWNLAALCQRCHLQIQGRVVMERAFILEHSPWFRLHAAGWYAVKYEGRDVTREEAAERMAELLAYESIPPAGFLIDPDGPSDLPAGAL